MRFLGSRFQHTFITFFFVYMLDDYALLVWCPRAASVQPQSDSYPKRTQWYSCAAWLGLPCAVVVETCEVRHIEIPSCLVHSKCHWESCKLRDTHLCIFCFVLYLVSPMKRNVTNWVRSKCFLCVFVFRSKNALFQFTCIKLSFFFSFPIIVP